MVFGATLTPLDFGSGVRTPAQIFEGQTYYQLLPSTNVKGGGARVLDDTGNQFFDSSDTAALSVSDQDVFACCFVRLARVTGTGMVSVGHWTGAGNQRSWLLGWKLDGSTNSFQALVSGDGTSSTSVKDTQVTPLVNTWHFIAWWYDHSESKIYIEVDNNGTVIEAAHSNIFDSTSDFSIGNLAALPFEGRISKVLFRKGEGCIPTAGERTSIYNSADGLMAGGISDLGFDDSLTVEYWPLNERGIEPSGSDALGAFNGIDLTENAGPILSGEGPEGTDYLANLIEDDLVAEWDDSESNSFTAPSVTSRPVYRPDTGVRFESPWNLQFASTLSTATTGAVIIRFIRLDNVSEQVLLSSSDASAADISWGLFDVSGALKFGVREGANVVTGDTTIPVGSPVVAAVATDGSTSTVYLGNSDDTTTTRAGSNDGDFLGDIAGRTNVTLGCLLENTDPFMGQDFAHAWITDVFVVEGTVTATQISQLNAWFTSERGQASINGTPAPTASTITVEVDDGLGSAVTVEVDDGLGGSVTVEATAF